MIYRDLSPEEVVSFRKWARDNFEPGEPIDPAWHPVVRQECLEMVAENEKKQDEEEAKVSPLWRGEEELHPDDDSLEDRGLFLGSYET
jgi:hypothetical protein